LIRNGPVTSRTVAIIRPSRRSRYCETIFILSATNRVVAIVAGCPSLLAMTGLLPTKRIPSKEVSINATNVRVLTFVQVLFFVASMASLFVFAVKSALRWRLSRAFFSDSYLPPFPLAVGSLCKNFPPSQPSVIVLRRHPEHSEGPSHLLLQFRCSCR
jgi:hypothetical protein